MRIVKVLDQTHPYMLHDPLFLPKGLSCRGGIVIARDRKDGIQTFVNPATFRKKSTEAKQAHMSLRSSNCNPGEVLTWYLST